MAFLYVNALYLVFSFPVLVLLKVKSTISSFLLPYVYSHSFSWIWSVMYVLSSICFMPLVFVGEWLAPLLSSYFMLLRMSSLSSSVSSRLLWSLKLMYLFSPRIVFAVSISSSSL